MPHQNVAAGDAQKNLHKYVAIIVDPVEDYLATDADDTKVHEKPRAAAANYFRAALTHAVSDAFAPVDQPEPLVLRLRADMAARQAFDEWASRLRAFLNKAHELKGEDMKRADESYKPYGAAPAAK